VDVEDFGILWYVTLCFSWDQTTIEDEDVTLLGNVRIFKLPATLHNIPED
jgi:hypothetical protein